MSNLKPYKLILQKDNNTSQIITDNLNNLTIIEDNIKLQGDVSICDVSSNILYKLPTISPQSVNTYLLSSDINKNLSFTQSNIFINNIITYYVSPSGNNSYSGSNVNNPFLTITYALSVIDNIASNIKICLTLLEGTFNENITITRPNLYIICNNLSTTSTIINGNIINSVNSNNDVDNSLIGFTINGNLTFNNSGSASFNMLVGNVTIYGITINNTSTVSNYGIVFNNFTSISSSNNNNLVSYGGRINILNGNFSQDNSSNTANMILIQNGNLTLSNTLVSSGNNLSNAPSIIKFNNTIAPSTTNNFLNSQIVYSSSTVNTGIDLQKVCLNFNNSVGVSNSMLNCFLLCEGSRRNPSGSKYDVAIKTGSGSVIMAFGGIYAGATANHIDTAIIHPSYVLVN
jgi:hypothetical protein